MLRGAHERPAWPMQITIESLTRLNARLKEALEAARLQISALEACDALTDSTHPGSAVRRVILGSSVASYPLHCVCMRVRACARACVQQATCTARHRSTHRAPCAPLQRSLVCAHSSRAATAAPNARREGRAHAAAAAERLRAHDRPPCVHCLPRLRRRDTPARAVMLPGARDRAWLCRRGELSSVGRMSHARRMATAAAAFAPVAPCRWCAYPPAEPDPGADVGGASAGAVGRRRRRRRRR